MELDKTSWSILACLQENARASFADIGREVGLSAPAVADRMIKLEQAGVIQGYRIDVDYEKTGYGLKAFIAFTAHAGKLLPFLNYIDKLDEVLECHRVTGNHCIYLKVVVENSGHLQELLARMMEYGETTTSIILSSPITHRIFTKHETRSKGKGRAAKSRLV
ncbi:MAG TPA: Lrp/AsnC family transcriptional regulator [Puia sp.]|jgi:Lrp/AsnC family leucine-responsive transcriptional regulator